MLTARVVNILFILAFFTVAIYAKGDKWHNLKEVLEEYGSYSSKDYHLRDDTVALEIRTYNIRDGKLRYKYTPISIYVVPKKLIDKSLLKKFINTEPDMKQKDEIRVPPDFPGDHTRAFALRKNGIRYRMSKISDVIYYLDTIDRPAEAYLIWWMHSRYSGDIDTKSWKNKNRPFVLSKKYRRTPKGYELLIKYRISREYFIRKSREQCSVFQDFTDRLHINREGKITYFKQVKKTKVKKECAEILCGGPPK